VDPIAVTNTFTAMSTTYTTGVTKASEAQRAAITALLKAEHLPAEDLPATLDHFFVVEQEGAVVGAIGLEAYGQVGLLRSMVVDQAFRGQSLATQLVAELERYAAAQGLHTLYLLTETADLYFEKKGYERIHRAEVPEALKASTEFSHVCPASATVMKKALSASN